jgi:ribosomal protein S12 methylthiotransferase
LEEWIGRAQLDRVGFFEYSREEGTSSAGLPGQVAAAQKRRRLVRLREAQRVASEKARAKRIGRTVRVLVEERRTLRKTDAVRSALGGGQAWFGRSMGEAPGVDGGIYFTGGATPGQFVEVTLDGNGPFDFFGRIVSKEVASIG